MLVTQEILGFLDIKRRCPQLTLMTLKGYLNIYGTEVEDYFDFGEIAVFEEEDMKTSVLCLVDLDADEPKKRRKKSPRRHAGLERRVKYRHRYTYTNPLNRICGYLILEESEKDEATLVVSAICSSSFAPITKGIGTDLMNTGIAFGELLGYRDIVLEVSNEHSQGADEESESEESEEEEEEMTEEEEIMDELVHTLAHEFWRKCLRRIPHPYYNLDKMYLSDLLTGYLVGYEEEEDSVSEEDTETSEEKEKGEEEPGDCDYGGYWYQRGKKSQQGLIGFYEHCGFAEDKSARVHFGQTPYPCFRYILE
jgi:hypothetical protein